MVERKAAAGISLALFAASVVAFLAVALGTSWGERFTATSSLLAPATAGKAQSVLELGDAEQTPRVAFIGDSYTTGAVLPLKQRNQRWTTLLAQHFGWIELNFGQGGTGYSARTVPEGCGLPQCVPYSERVADVVAAHPDLVVVSGGRNDIGFYRQADSRRALRMLREGLPETPIFVLSPFYDSSPEPLSLNVIRQDLRAACAEVGVTFVEVDNPLQGRRDLIQSDGIHPNTTGYSALSVAAVSGLQRYVDQAASQQGA